jgi:cytochrome c peroxidase
MLKIQFLAAAFLLSLIITVASIYLYSMNKQPDTQLVEFTTPFVFGRFQIPENNPLTVESVKLGRRLFYDPLLSKNNKVSCSSCHKQSLAFTDGLAFSVGVSGKALPFNSMSLVNLMWGPKNFFWNGRATSLEDQALQPIEHVDEMGSNLNDLIEELSEVNAYQILFKQAYGEINTENIAKALASFQRSLISSNSRYDQYLRGETSLSEQEELGRKLFMAHPDTKVSLRGGNCIDCHSQFLTSGFASAFDGFSNNGLDDDENLAEGLYGLTKIEAHRGLFKAPTLRNIAVTSPYMHDGRFKTLEEVLAHYNGGIKKSKTLSPLIIEADNLANKQVKHISLNLSSHEVAAIIAFLHTLTDESFLTNKAFSDPFTEGELND